MGGDAAKSRRVYWCFCSLKTEINRQKGGWLKNEWMRGIVIQFTVCLSFLFFFFLFFDQLSLFSMGTNCSRLKARGNKSNSSPSAALNLTILPVKLLEHSWIQTLFSPSSDLQINIIMTFDKLPFPRARAAVAKRIRPDMEMAHHHRNWLLSRSWLKVTQAARQMSN